MTAAEKIAPIQDSNLDKTFGEESGDESGTRLVRGYAQGQMEEGVRKWGGLGLVISQTERGGRFPAILGGDSLTGGTGFGRFEIQKAEEMEESPLFLIASGTTRYAEAISLIAPMKSRSTEPEKYDVAVLERFWISWWGRGHEETVELALKKWFVMKHPRPIVEFVVQNEGIVEFLHEVRRQILRVFKENAKEIRLRKYTDPDDGEEGLTVTIKTDFDANDSLDLLHAFDDQWWLEVENDLANKLIIQVESRGV